MERKEKMGRNEKMERDKKIGSDETTDRDEKIESNERMEMDEKTGGSIGMKMDGRMEQVGKMEREVGRTMGIGKDEVFLKWGERRDEEWSEEWEERYWEVMGREGRKVVVLDDDPTGIQTVHGVFVYTDAGMKYLWLLCCTALIFLLCARAANTAAAVGCAAVCGGIAALMAGSTQLWLRNLSLWQLADGQALCREAVYLNLLGSPQDRVLCGAIFLLVLALAAGIVGAALYAQTPGGSGKRMAFTRSLPRPRHTCLAGHELYKALISRCGLWILLAFFAVIALLYGRFSPERSEFEVYYRNYSEILSGAPSQEKDDYLASELARFDGLNEQLAELAQQYPDAAAFDREAEPIRNQLRMEDAFHLAQNQYRALRPGQVYLYQTGYQRLLGADALRQDVLELGGAFLAVALLLFGSFAGERESGVEALLTASPRRKSVVQWKCVIAGGYVLLLTLALWLPGLLTVQGAYGPLDMAAQANSVQCLSALSADWTVGGVVLALLASRLLLLAASAATVMLLSRRCATVPTLLLSLLLLLLPVGAAYAWM